MKTQARAAASHSFNWSVATIGDLHEFLTYPHLTQPPPMLYTPSSTPRNVLQQPPLTFFVLTGKEVDFTGGESPAMALIIDVPQDVYAVYQRQLTKKIRTLFGGVNLQVSQQNAVRHFPEKWQRKRHCQKAMPAMFDFTISEVSSNDPETLVHFTGEALRLGKAGTPIKAGPVYDPVEQVALFLPVTGRVTRGRGLPTRLVFNLDAAEPYCQNEWRQELKGLVDYAI